MAKKNAPIEEPIEETIVDAFEANVELTTEEVTEPVAEEVVEAPNPLANGWPSRDFFTPIPGINDVKEVAADTVTEAPAENGGQE
jgi:hypothetical protein